MSLLRPRLVLVYRRTELDELLDRHSTRGQAEFFLKTRGRSLKEVDATHNTTVNAWHTIRQSVPADWNVTEVERADLTRFHFQPTDVIAVVGPDGLVANVSKYLDGQPVVGINPLPAQNIGILVPHSVYHGSQLISAYATGKAFRTQSLTMAQCDLDDGQSLTALNEIFVGHPSHQSARYLLHDGTRDETQSSSGLIASTGTGATGWAASLTSAHTGVSLPAKEEHALAWFVREAWPSPATGTSLVSGRLAEEGELHITVQSERLIAFGDGMEDDHLVASWGQKLRIHVAERHLQLVNG